MADADSLDATFGSGGRRVFVLDIGGSLTDAANGMLRQSDGKLVASGFTGEEPAFGKIYLRCARC